MAASFSFNRHTRKDHPNFTSPESDEEQSEEAQSKEDYIMNYHKAKMRYGLLLADINDAIREGDGKRLVNLYHIALLIYKCYGRSKYSYTCLLFLTKLNAILPAEKAEGLIWNRFCNNHGKKGKNISLDLRMDQLNNLLKACLKVLGSNFNEVSAQRVARTIGRIEEILASIDKDCMNPQEIKGRSKTDPTEAVTQIVTELTAQDAFIYTPGREGYPSFPKFNANLLGGLDYRDLYRWIKDKLSDWSKIYEQ